MTKVLFVGGEWNMTYHEVRDKRALRPYSEIHVPKKIELNRYCPDNIDPFDLLNNVDTYVIPAFTEFPHLEVAILKGYKISLWTTDGDPKELTSMVNTFARRNQPVLAIDYNWYYDTYDWYYVEEVK